MIIDSLLQFSDAQALTSTAASTNVVPLSAERRIGTGEPMAVVIVLDVASDGTTGDETYSVQVQSDTDVAFGSAASVGGALSIPRGTAAGTKYVIPIGPGTATETYLRLYYTLDGTTPTVTVTAFLQPLNAIQNDAYYADGFTIS